MPEKEEALVCKSVIRISAETSAPKDSLKSFQVMQRKKCCSGVEYSTADDKWSNLITLLLRMLPFQPSAIDLYRSFMSQWKTVCFMVSCVVMCLCVELRYSCIKLTTSLVHGQYFTIGSVSCKFMHRLSELLRSYCPWWLKYLWNPWLTLCWQQHLHM